MSPDASNIVGSILRSLEPDKSAPASSRSSEIAQSQLAGESEGLVHQMRTTATDAVKNKIKHEHEYKRRHFERHNNPSSEQEEDDDGSQLDVVV